MTITIVGLKKIILVVSMCNLTGCSLFIDFPPLVNMPAPIEENDCRRQQTKEHGCIPKHSFANWKMLNQGRKRGCCPVFVC